MFALRFALLIIFCLSAASASHGTSPGFCDPSKTATRTDPYGYRSRPGRCEGRFRKRRSGELFYIAGYVSGARTVSASSTRPIRLSWPQAVTDTVKIRANALVSVPYQMDTRVAPPVQEFNWPTEILRALRLDIGVLGLKASVVHGPQWQDSVLIPLRIDGAAADPSLRLVIYSFSALRDVELSVRDPRTQALLLHSRISTGAPAHHPFEITIPPELPPARYHAVVGVTLSNGAPATADAVILVPGRASDW